MPNDQARKVESNTNEGSEHDFTAEAEIIEISSKADLISTSMAVARWEWLTASRLYRWRHEGKLVGIQYTKELWWRPSDILKICAEQFEMEEARSWEKRTPHSYSVATGSKRSTNAKTGMRRTTTKEPESVSGNHSAQLIKTKQKNAL